MANTFSQIYIHIVFSVKGRMCLIPKDKRSELEMYIAGIIKSKGQKMLQIFSMPDHTHILLSISPDISISDLVRDIKASSSKFINTTNWIKGRFSWQEGFGAFSYSKSQVNNVVSYISGQEAHHKSFSFREEYLAILEKFDIPHNDKYLFDWID
jgi:REP element-mobilizing transposase RayT